MPAYKDTKNGTWYIKTYVKTWDGKKKSTTKRGFTTKREAIKWESEIKAKEKNSVDVKFSTFVEMYFNDKRGELKERSIKNKKYMIERHILPFFGNKKINEISPAEIVEWQNQMIAKDFSETYLRMIQNQITALFTHASKIYGLEKNPCKKVRKMGKSDANRIDFWTKEEYEKFIETIDYHDRYYCLFEILFWTGLRIGELLALTMNDIDFDANQIHVSKTYYRIDGEDKITTPKTEQSNRTVDIPEFLKDEIRDYCNRLYKYPHDERLFLVGQEAVQHKFKRNIEKAGVKKIRVHDLRHSHVAYLIHQGVEPLMIKERLGHKDIKITLNTYGHLYPNEQKKIALMLNERK